MDSTINLSHWFIWVLLHYLVNKVLKLNICIMMYIHLMFPFSLPLTASVDSTYTWNSKDTKSMCHERVQDTVKQGLPLS